MEITWQVDDGYAGKGRPQSCNVPDSDLKECETEEECKALIEEYVADDFTQSVSWTYTYPEDEIAELLKG